MMAHPGKKLLFMGQEFAQFKEWDYKTELDWGLLEYETHRNMLYFNQQLNKFYLENSPLWENDDTWEGFSWISNDDYTQSVIAFRRIDDKKKDLIVVCNFVPVAREDYKIGVPKRGRYKLVFNSDAKEFMGSGIADDFVSTMKLPMHGHDHSISLKLAALSVMYLEYIPLKRKINKKLSKSLTGKKKKAKKVVDRI
jgi:1,4-alpha-glucan branching enzyme